MNYPCHSCDKYHCAVSSAILKGNKNQKAILDRGRMHISGVVFVSYCIMSIMATSQKHVLKKGEDGFNLLRTMANEIDKAAPPNKNGPTMVKVGLYINSFDSISEINMDYSLNMYFRMAWQDPQLAFTPEGNIDNIKAPDGYWDNIWTPDIFFRNEKQSELHDLVRPLRLLKVNSTGHIWYVTKFTAILSCPMKLQKYPMDTQTCPVMIESYGYTTKTLQFGWLDSPVEADVAIQLPQYTLKDIVLYDCTQNYTSGSFPCLEIRFVLTRNHGYFVMQIFVPSIVLVMVSWLQFYTSTKSRSDRIQIGLISVLALVAQMVQIRSTLPKVSYVMAVDVWMCACLLFAFASLLELPISQSLNKRKGGYSGSKSNVVACIIFPAAFFVFVTIYFIIYS